MGGGSGIAGKRRGRGKSRNTSRGLMRTDNGRGELTGSERGQIMGEQWGKRQENCN